VTAAQLRRTGLVALAALSTALGVTAGAGASARHATPGSYLQVTLVEYHLFLSRGVVRAGPVNLQEIDGGMDPHDLRLRHGTSLSSIGEPQLDPGQRFNAIVYLRPGTYHLWCSLPGHWKLGMHAILKVVR
jgi:hypothetical protein